MGGNRVQNVATPVAATDAANKAYVDAMSGNVDNLQAAIDAQTARINSAFQQIDRNTEGIAIALAMSGIALPDSKVSAISGGRGFFRQQTSVRSADSAPAQRCLGAQRWRGPGNAIKSSGRALRRHGGMVSRQTFARFPKSPTVAGVCMALALGLGAQKVQMVLKAKRRQRSARRPNKQRHHQRRHQIRRTKLPPLRQRRTSEPTENCG
jgi:hypothetical protein